MSTAQQWLMPNTPAITALASASCSEPSWLQVENYECRHELNKFTAVYLFDALYAALFGLTIMCAGLEWVFFINIRGLDGALGTMRYSIVGLV